MNAVLKEDFEKKMTVVGLLKQYAEQRDVDTFARGLAVVLASQTHQSLLQYIRSSLVYIMLVIFRVSSSTTCALTLRGKIVLLYSVWT